MGSFLRYNLTMNKTIIFLIGAVILLAVVILVGPSKNNEASLSPTPFATISPVVSASNSPTVSVSPSVSVTPRVSASVTPISQKHTITLTAAGVSTKSLTIKSGDTVTFVNQDTAPHWPASGPHPVHTTCPGFDALKGLKTGESYSHTFIDKKTCPFHDHLNLSSIFMGSIVVE